MSWPTPQRSRRLWWSGSTNADAKRGQDASKTPTSSPARSHPPSFPRERESKRFRNQPQPPAHTKNPMDPRFREDDDPGRTRVYQPNRSSNLISPSSPLTRHSHAGGNPSGFAAKRNHLPTRKAQWIPAFARMTARERTSPACLVLQPNSRYSYHPLRHSSPHPRHSRERGTPP